MNEFDEYLCGLADHEDEWNKKNLGPRERILVNAGVRLNWLGDFLANPKIKYKKIDLPVDQVVLTGTNPDWNRILLDKCGRSVEKFRALIERDKKVREKFTKEASFGTEPILTRGPDEKGFYHVFDGMHRFVGAVIKNRRKVKAYVPTNADKHLPVCEPHTVYDLIRGYGRHARGARGRKELYHALKLLARTYENVPDLLRKRFSAKYIPDDEVQKIIKKVVRETKKR